MVRVSNAFRYSRWVASRSTHGGRRPGLGSARKYFDYWRRARRGAGPDYLILFVGSRCGGGCGHCLYRDRLNRDDDLSMAELRRISRTAGPLSALLLSGGEPFSRPELVQIVSMLVRRNGVLTCAIPTSGVHPEQVVQATRQLLLACPQLHLAVSPSVDGPPRLNDSLRFDGSYQAARQCVRGLVELRRQFPRLEVVAHSVLSSRNAASLEALMERVQGWGVTGHSVELIRDPRLLPPLPRVQRLHRLVLRNRARYLHGALERVAILGSLSLAQRTKERSLQGQSFACVAGRRVVVLDADGGLRACEQLPPAGNVRDFGCDLGAAWRALAPRAPARCQRCTHVCFINASLAADPWSLLKIPAEYLRVAGALGASGKLAARQRGA